MTILRIDLPATKWLFERMKVCVHSDPLKTEMIINLSLSSIKQIFYTRPDHSSATDPYFAVKN